MCITKAYPPEAPPKLQIAKAQKDGTLPLAVQTQTQRIPGFEKTIKKGAITKQAAGTGQFGKADVEYQYFIPHLLEDLQTDGSLERKLQVTPGEWYIESMYHNEDVAALYNFWHPVQGPFLIVPSLVHEGIISEYTLTIFSSKAVEVQKLEDARNAVLTGRWTEESAGGCHLYDTAFEKKEDKLTWKNNPKFHLCLHTTAAKAEVKITLSRPEKAWKKIAKSSVACMIGMYVYPYVENQAPTTESMLNQYEFHPTNQMEEILNIDGNPNGYMIMPTTYEPKMTGPFILSVSTDVDFELNQIEE